MSIRSLLVGSLALLPVVLFPARVLAETPPAPAASAEGHADAPSGEHGKAEGEHGKGEGEHGKGEGEHGKGEEHEEEKEAALHLGADFITLAAFHKDVDTKTVFGGGLFVEWVAIPKWLELELGAHLIPTEGGVEVPVDLILKHPFEVTEKLHLFVGLGPAVVAKINIESSTTPFGLATVVGGDYWIVPHAGLTLTINYNALADDGLLSEFGGTAGVIFGF